MKKRVLILIPLLIFYTITVSAQTKEEEEIFDFAEVEPEFPGGIIAMLKFVTENTCYPEYEQEIGIQGNVFVQFVVDTSGKVSNGEIRRGISHGIDSVTLKMLEQMPLWTPGTISGRKVKVRYTIPVNFKIKGNTIDPVFIPAVCTDPKKKK